MSEESNSDFIDSGVDDIASSLGLGSSDSEQETIDNENDVSTSENETIDADNGEIKKEEEATTTTKAPPASWAKDRHEAWAKIPPEAQEYIELREKQMLDGIEQYKQGYQYAHTLNQAIEPFRQDIAATGMDEASAIAGLLNHHRALTTGTVEQRQQALLEIGIASGIIPREGQTQADLERNAYEQQIRQYQAMEQQRQQHYIAQQQQQIAKTVESFAADPAHEYFDEVADEIAALLQLGHDLQSAYDKAVWANPVTRAKELAKEQQKITSIKAEQQRKEAEAAKRAAAVNMRSANRQGRSSEPLGSWDDTMNETLQSIRNR